jgi:hypothetical protein
MKGSKPDENQTNLKAGVSGLMAAPGDAEPLAEKVN